MTEYLQNLNLAFLSMPGGSEWFVILIIGLLVFGRRLPEVARGLGKTVNEFKKGLREFQDSADEVVQDVNKLKSEVVSEVKDASGLDEYGSYGADSTADNAKDYAYHQTGPTTPEIGHDSVQHAAEAAGGQNETLPPATP